MSVQILAQPSLARSARRWGGDVVPVVGASLLVALCAQIAVPLPFTPVPLTGSTLGVLLAGGLLGSRRGAVCLALYLLEGAAGLPFFAQGGAGLTALLGPRGGYLLGFVPAAWMAGFLCERGWSRRAQSAVAAMLLSSLVIFAFGLAWLSRFVPEGQLLASGWYPFIPGDIAKCCMAAAILLRRR